MSTSLYAITNSKLTGKETVKDYELIVEKLKALKLGKTSHIEYTNIAKGKNKTIKEKGDWNYQIEEKNEYFPYSVSFQGPFDITPHLYNHICILHTIYRYSFIYETKTIKWFPKFRNELFQIVTIVGGTEVIWLADNSCDKVGGYLEGMAEEGEPYEKIKKKMIKEMGKPVTDYSLLNYDKLDYRNINEFFLDDFNDLK